tara:strand:+ start:157 stop:378 length:222 start_codon:yes stop_codon:yes gene_type:complete
MFPEGFIEVICIYDASKLDLSNEKGFAFGRFIRDSIECKKASLLVLYSEYASKDHQRMEQRSVANQGIVIFFG